MKPWSAAITDGRITRPLRHNGLPYSGVNVLLLWSEGMARGFSSPMWITFKQALELGAAVRKGETGSTLVFASRFTKSEADGHGNEVDKEIPFLKAYSVFNMRPPDPVERIEHADHFFRNTGALIRHGGTQAYYSPIMDYIHYLNSRAVSPTTTALQVDIGTAWVEAFGWRPNRCDQRETPLNVRMRDASSGSSTRSAASSAESQAILRCPFSGHSVRCLVTWSG